MRTDTCGVRRERRARFESFEERLALSAEPVGDVLQQNELSDVPQPAYAEVATALADSYASAAVSAAHNSFGFSGQGQTVAVIDSGVAYDHLALGGGFGDGYRVVGGWDFTEENDANPYDDGPAGFHGTHVAGIIASGDELYTGVAPEADLVALRVVNDYGVSELEWVENALQWVHDNRDAFENPITTVNLSLGTDWNAETVPEWATLEDEFALLEADGIFISVAAGNSFAKFNEAGLSYPAASEFVVPVASHDADGNLSDFSQRTERVLVAPGEYITSSVPGHLYGMPGPSKFYMSTSGTSMAAPYVAGASVLLRQAMEFAGYENINQDVINDHLRDTADLVFDEETGAYYHRLDLEQALDTLLPDEFGSTESSAFAIGTIEDSAVLSGLIGRLDDQDYFTFTAGASGKAQISIDGSHALVANWTVAGAEAVLDGDRLSFDVSVGESYTVALGTSEGLGYYELALTLEASNTNPPPPSQDPLPVDVVDWGSIDFASFADKNVTTFTNYLLAASRTGKLTVEASFDSSRGDIAFDIYDGLGKLRGSSSATELGQRLDLDVHEGDVFELRFRGSNEDVDFRVTNLVAVHDGRIEIVGTDLDDTFEFSAGTNHVISVNGVSYEFASAEISEVHFDGSGGNDALQLVGSADNESAVLEVGSVSLSSSSYEVTAVDMETIDLIGGGGYDQVKLYDSESNDMFVARPESVSLSGDGFENSATGFSRVAVYATSGTDQAVMHDSSGSDRFYGRSNSALMKGSGFYNYAVGFDVVTAHATSGTDRAWLYDSKGSDRLVAYPDRVSLSGEGFANTADGFDRVYAYATRGGHDEAIMYDSAGNDRFFARSTYSMMRGRGYYNYARGFDSVMAYATSGGRRDTAYLYGTAGVELVTVSGSDTTIQGARFSNGASGFESVRTYGRGGADEAVFREIGSNDSLLGRRNYARYRTEGRETRVYDFDVLSAHAAAGEVADADVRAVAYLFDQYGQWKS